MALTENELDKIARLAYLDCQSEINPHLAAEVKAIMSFVEELRQVDTSDIAPLFHPLDLHQRLRDDEISEQDCSAALAEAAPSFEEGYYLVPKVIDSGQ